MKRAELKKLMEKIVENQEALHIALTVHNHEKDGDVTYKRYAMPGEDEPRYREIYVDDINAAFISTLEELGNEDEE